MFKKLLLSTLLLFVAGSTLYAEKISQYTIDINIEQSGELSIVESIEYDFETQNKHGMFRDIPFTIKRDSRMIDLELYEFSVQMDGGMVPWEQSTMKSTNAGDIIRLKIGSADTYVTDKILYRVAYRVKKGVFPSAQNEENDAVRWNIIGTGWEIPISNIKANFFLPNALGQHDIALSSYTGEYGKKSSTAQSIWINSKQLQVTVKTLKPHEGATVELAYPANRLDQNGLDNVKATFMDWFLANWHWGALVGYLLYFRKMYEKHTGFVDKRSVAVQYYPPKDISILEAGLVLDKFADNKDFSAAVLELAELGYIEIHQASKSSEPILQATSKSIHELGIDQKYLMKQVLFKGSSKTFTFTKGSASKAKALQSAFKQINDTLYKWVVSDGYMLENPQRVRKNFLLKSILYLLPIVALTFYGFYQKFGIDVIFMLLFPIIFGTVGLTVALQNKGVSNKIFGGIFILSGFTPLIGLMQNGMNIKTLLFGPFGILLILGMAMFYTYKKIGRFTQKGAYTRKHLLGLQEFIARVKQDEIKRRLALDPLYLEKLLPYAVLFDETKHWLSFFALLSVQTPLWYHGHIRHVDDFTSSVDSASTPPSKSSGGSGFSGGGGSSGGGGGGGGGGSW